MATPTTLVITGGNGQAVNLNTFTGVVSCNLRDENNNPMAGEPVVFSLPASGPSGLFTTTGNITYNTVTDGNGNANTGGSNLYTNFTAGSWVGSVQAVNNLALSAGFNITNVDNPIPTTLSAVANGIQKAAQNAAYLPVTVLVRDQFNSPMAGVTVAFTVPSGRGTWPGGGLLTRTAVTNGSGQATSPVLTASAVLGQFAISVAAGSLSSTSIVSFTTIDPAVVTSISAYSGSNQTAALNFPFALPLVARAANAVGSPVAGVAVLFTAPASGASCSFPVPFVATVTIITDVNGLATSPTATANGTAGSYSVAATKAGAQTAYFGLTNGGAAPTLTDALAMCEA